MSDHSESELKFPFSNEKARWCPKVMYFLRPLNTGPSEFWTEVDHSKTRLGQYSDRGYIFR